MADTPDAIVLERHRDLRSPGFNLAVRYVLLALVAVVVVAGLANAFGQRPSTDRYTSPKVDVGLYAPDTLRSGLFYEARFTIVARAKLDHAVLVLAPGWAESQTINTIEPGPIGETSHDGALALTLGTIGAGARYTLYLQLQVNPTNVGRHDTDFALYDGDTRLLAAHRTLAIFP